MGLISALGSKSAQANWTVKALIKGATQDPPKIGLNFTHRNGPICTAKTDLSELQ